MTLDLNVYSFKRSGTNMFSAFLSRSRNILPVNTGGGKFISRPALRDYPARSIYSAGVSFTYDEEDFLYAFDEVRPADFSCERRAIALIRPLDEINRSIKAMYRQVHGYYIPYLRKSPYITATEHLALDELARRPEVLAISVSHFVNNVEYFNEVLPEYLGVSGFRSLPTAISEGCCCGSEFSIVRTNELPDEPRMKIAHQDFLFCPVHQSIMVAAGSHNPYSKIDPKRQPPPKESLLDFNLEYNNTGLI